MHFIAGSEPNSLIFVLAMQRKHCYWKWYVEVCMQLINNLQPHEIYAREENPAWLWDTHSELGKKIEILQLYDFNVEFHLTVKILIPGSFARQTTACNGSVLTLILYSSQMYLNYLWTSLNKTDLNSYTGLCYHSYLSCPVWLFHQEWSYEIWVALFDISSFLSWVSVQ